MIKRTVWAVVWLVCVWVVSPGVDKASAGGDGTDRVAVLEQKVMKLENQLRDVLAELRIVREDKKTELSVHKFVRTPEEERAEAPFTEGLHISLGVTGVYQATSGANGDSIARNSEDVNDASYSIGLGIDKNFGDYGFGFLGLECGGGDGVEGELQVYSNVNFDADNDENVQVAELYYEHYFSQIPLSLMAGKLDATVHIDANAYANDETTQFLGRMFRNSPTIEFPDNAAGIKALVEPADSWSFEFMAMDAESDFEDFFDQMFMGAQLTLKPNFVNRPGNYRLIGWTSDRPHLAWQDPSNTKEGAWGLAMSIDQELTDDIGFFGRYAWQDEDVYLDGSDFSLEQSYSFGLQLTGTTWGRADDNIGLAFGQIFPSDDYKAVQNVRAKTESHLEAYYAFRVNEHLTISPDIQVIWDPFGEDAANGSKAITVYGMRGQLDF